MCAVLLEQLSNLCLLVRPLGAFIAIYIFPAVSMVFRENVFGARNHHMLYLGCLLLSYDYELRIHHIRSYGNTVAL
jgi:hypothetical protein